MYEIKRGNKFRKSYKRISNSGIFDHTILDLILSFLLEGKELPNNYYDHALTGNFFGLRECHISSDCLLLYEINREEKSVRLVNIGNHANLFE